MNKEKDLWGLVDVFVGGTLERDGAVLVADSGGQLDPELGRIPSGRLLLHQGLRSERIVLERQSAPGSAFNTLEIHPALARKLGLKDDTRYKLSYDPDTRVLYLLRWPKIRKPAEFRIDDSLPPGYVSISPDLLVALGVPGLTSRMVLMRGERQMVCELDIPEEGKRGVFALPPGKAKLLRLTDGRRYSLLFDQVRSRLWLSTSSLRPAPAWPEPKKDAPAGSPTTAGAGSRGQPNRSWAADESITVAGFHRSDAAPGRIEPWALPGRPPLRAEEASDAHGRRPKQR
ncbi:hypothetical protein ACFQWB_02250 [Paenibacillus thermoaerophilus]|uniref:DUF4340 domain-containing protein n=1 Tax=Paenibacillus thermoaerophilus TaxID=1215385 RepID=A0ABW2UY11_9BACL|nr:hypothetical protein [Paenibacillus thermoaerophilus]TMV19164.1 hypothetical protein FE781_01265 [Paenibacillus thermoaerophilus]